MREISTSDLRSSQGEILHAVLQGETMRLTRMGLPVAILVPPLAYERLVAVKVADLARQLDTRPAAIAPMVTQLIKDWTHAAVIVEAGNSTAGTLLTRDAALELGRRYLAAHHDQDGAGHDQ